MRTLSQLSKVYYTLQTSKISVRGWAAQFAEFDLLATQVPWTILSLVRLVRCTSQYLPSTAEATTCSLGALLLVLIDGIPGDWTLETGDGA